MSNLKTYSALFGGFDLAGHGLQQAGLHPLEIFEIDPRLSEVGQTNTKGKYVIADVQDVNWRRHEKPDVLWASTICTNASPANSKAGETLLDMKLAEATTRAIETWMPEVFFLENVWMYRHFNAFGHICEILTRRGYWFDVHHVNTADYGVPQTRKRLILRAARDGWLPPMPKRTAWKGWLGAVEDLVPDLPDTEFADWQLKRINGEMLESFIVASNSGPASWGDNIRGKDEPSFTVTTNAAGRTRAFLFDSKNTRPGDDWTDREARRLSVREGAAPAFTINASSNRGMPRALIFEGSANSKSNAFSAPIRKDDDPMFTVRASISHNMPRALLVDCTHRTSAPLTCRRDDEPAFTSCASHARRPSNLGRAWIENGRVVSITSRALARFQTVADSFELSGHLETDCKGIGNGVPCELSRLLGVGVLQ